MFGTLAPWRAAREVIDWTLEGRSIFDRKKPLAAKTIARILAGAVKFHWPEPFLAVLRGQTAPFDPESPATLTPFCLSQGAGGVARDVAAPLPTIVAGGAVALVQPMLVTVTGGDRPKAAQSIDGPLRTITTKNGVAIAEAMLAPYYGASASCVSIENPMPTVTTKARFGVVEPFLTAHFGERPTQTPRTHSLSDPLPTITSRGGGELASATIEPAAGEQLRRAAAQGRLIEIDGTLYVIDIRFRMLEPAELARATGFSDSEAEYEFAGTKTDVTRQIGNAVPVNVARALVAALFTEN